MKKKREWDDVIPQILEINAVIQGEGRSTGTPMILIRLGGCNLNCMFKGSICDSEESSWDFTKNEPKKFSFNDIKAKFEENPNIHHVMITGGQPTLNEDLFDFLLSSCRLLGKKVEIEDNGTTFPHNVDVSLINLVSLSPKLKNSIPVEGTFVEKLNRKVTKKDVQRHASRYRNIESLKHWIQSSDYQLKFVISDEDQIKEAFELAIAVGASSDRIYFMPEGATQAQLSSRRKWLYERCIELGVKYTDRLHIIVYDDLKGV